MKTDGLKNYGRSLLEMMGGLPEELLKEISGTSFEIIGGHLAPGDMKRFKSYLSQEKKRMLSKTLYGLSERGLNSEEFIHQQIEWAASFSAFSRMKGVKHAIEVFSKMVELTYPRMFSVLFPAPQDLAEFEDPLNAFREWFLVMMDANKRAGVHDYALVENGDDVFQVNCTWCAWFEILDQLGAREACVPVCHTDDVFFPGYLNEIGIGYRRKNTLARGGDYCDFRFERLDPEK